MSANMPTYRVQHKTLYKYTDPVMVCHNETHLRPIDSNRQTLKSFQLKIEPTPEQSSLRSDYFGNVVDCFAIFQSHDSLTITADSEVEVKAPPLYTPAQSTPWETVRDGTVRDGPVGEEDTTPIDLLVSELAFDSPRVHRNIDLANYVKISFTPGKPILEAALDLMGRIYKDFEYNPNATNVNSSLADVLELRAGVCQDLAHVGIGCLRSLGLSARYVSGYLRTIPPAGQEKLVGADESHAWYSLYCGDLGWVDFDPTNNVIPSTDHITIGFGRDYGDVCPVQGVFTGGGDHKLSVAVTVSAQK